MHRLTDTHNRQINYLRVSVTDRCNLRCIYCMPKEGISLIGHDDILRFEEIISVARAAAAVGISKIRMTGGEPLVRKGIAELVARLREIEGITDLSMTTNGILLKSSAGALRRAGLRRINISLDSLDPGRYKSITRGGDLSAVLEGIREARLQGFDPIKINVVAMSGVNDDEMTSFAKLTLDRPVHIRFIEFMPFEGDSKSCKSRFIPSSEIQRRIAAVGRLVPIASEQQSGPARMFKLQGAQGKIGFISPLSNHFCSSCNRLRLTADGKLRTCLFSDNEIDLKEPLRSGCTQAGLQQIITEAIRSKPLRHNVLDRHHKKCLRGMSAIGG